MERQDRTQEDIQEAVEQIREYKTEIERMEACIRELKEDLRELLEAHGGSWSDNEGYARLVSEGERTSYQTDALDKLIINDPLRYGWLKDYRQTSPVAPRVQVK